jgi:uncharacterized protein (DUF2164 family)
MDLNEHISKIVDQIVGEITENVSTRVDKLILDAITSRLDLFDYNTHVQQAANAALDKKASQYTIDGKKLEKRISDRINETIDGAQTSTAELINTIVSEKLTKININQAVNDATAALIVDRLREITFPENSINPTALKLNELIITGDNIKGGLIENFSSTGIDDRATGVALTILDDVTVVENNLLTKDLTVEGLVSINGNLSVNGEVDKECLFYTDLIKETTTSALSNMDRGLFDSFSSLVFDRIKTEGLNLSKIKLNDTEVIVDNRLGPTIISSNLQHLGILKELQVSGESLLAETLYVTPKRVGINTIEPSGALAIWDQEVEIVASKKSADTGSFGTPRKQKLILTSNNKENIILDDDGSAAINDLRIGGMRFTAAANPPNYVSQRGHVVWNVNPNLGGPLGWVCLGSANWANFGIID